MMNRPSTSRMNTSPELPALPPRRSTFSNAGQPQLQQQQPYRPMPAVPQQQQPVNYPTQGQPRNLPPLPPKPKLVTTYTSPSIIVNEHPITTTPVDLQAAEQEYLAVLNPFGDSSTYSTPNEPYSHLSQPNVYAQPSVSPRQYSSPLPSLPLNTLPPNNISGHPLSPTAPPVSPKPPLPPIPIANNTRSTDAVALATSPPPTLPLEVPPPLPPLPPSYPPLELPAEELELPPPLPSLPPPPVLEVSDDEKSTYVTPPQHQSEPLPQPFRVVSPTIYHSTPLETHQLPPQAQLPTPAPPSTPLPPVPSKTVSQPQIKNTPTTSPPTSTPTSPVATPTTGRATLVSSTESPSPMLDNPLQKTPSTILTHRDRVALEILHTERNYIANLTFLVQTFLVPLRSAKSEGFPVLSNETISQIFCNIEEIILVNKILLSDLEKRMLEWSSNPRVGDIFEKLTHFFKMYNRYTAQYDTALATLGDCEKQPAFAQFVRQWEDDPNRSCNLNLRALLIQPVQRIPRYRLLLEDMIKHTEPTHPDYEPLRSSLEKVKQVADNINDSIKKAENRQKVLEIQNSFVSNSIFTSEVRIVEPSRVFIKEGGLLKICRKARKMRYFFLFNDILIYADIIPIQEKYIMHLQLELAKLRLQDIPDREGGRDPLQNCFQIISPKKSFTVIAKSKEEKYQWMSAIMTAIDEEVRRKQTLARKEKTFDAGFEAPVWVQDKDATHCFKCHDEFTFVNRRHHCRACGNVVCGDCSNRRITLPGVGTNEPQRVCVNCYYSIRSKASGNYSVVIEPRTN
eukprot:TRINITY_DN4877_c0_g1_i1.p1 TRINITY_DN4877_c0_g1~~TRINITY_DN4877_c0_g1_i1.p1  ORF type:complete len:794 (-),score=150.51 TRINITY_DN4877_c0_g1_i1:107-2488(-)